LLQICADGTQISNEIEKQASLKMTTGVFAAQPIADPEDSAGN
jgi:hypothetical protein